MSLQQSSCLSLLVAGVTSTSYYTGSHDFEIGGLHLLALHCLWSMMSVLPRLPYGSFSGSHVPTVSLSYSIAWCVETYWILGPNSSWLHLLKHTHLFSSSDIPQTTRKEHISRLGDFLRKGRQGFHEGRQL